VPVVPFRLQSLGYTGVSNLVGWLLFAFVGDFYFRSGGLVTRSFVELSRVDSLCVSENSLCSLLLQLTDYV
jgi:hypothetical protein